MTTRVPSALLAAFALALCALALPGCSATDMRAVGARFRHPEPVPDRATIVVFARKFDVAIFRDVDVLVDGTAVGRLEPFGAVIASVEPGEVSVAARTLEAPDWRVRHVSAATDPARTTQANWIGEMQGGELRYFEVSYAGGIINFKPLAIEPRDVPAVPEGELREVITRQHTEPLESEPHATIDFVAGSYRAEVLRDVYIDDTYALELGGPHANVSVRVKPGTCVVTCRWIAIGNHPAQYDYAVGHLWGMRQRSHELSLVDGQRVTMTIETDPIGDFSGAMMHFRVKADPGSSAD